MLIRPFEIDDNNACCDLIESSFAEFIEPGFEEEGRQAFYSHLQEERKRELLPDDIFGFVAQDSNDIVGVVQIRKNTYIHFLYVDKRWHRQGISRKLVEAASDQVAKRSPDATHLTVKSSLYAVAAYLCMGFTQEAEQINEKGVISVRLRLDI